MNDAKPITMAAELRKIADLLDKGVAVDVVLFVGQGGQCGYQMNAINQPWPLFASMTDCALTLREATHRAQHSGRIQLLQ